MGEFDSATFEQMALGDLRQKRKDEEISDAALAESLARLAEFVHDDE